MSGIPGASRSRLAATTLICILAAAMFAGCSLPNLEPEQCVAARDAVKQFYSFYFAHDMNSIEGARGRSNYLTNELSSQLAGPKKEGKDYFTASENFPKAFRVGACTSESNDAATLDVVMLWNDDSGNAQKEIKVDVVYRFGKWLINKVTG